MHISLSTIALNGGGVSAAGIAACLLICFVRPAASAQVALDTFTPTTVTQNGPTKQNTSTLGPNPYILTYSCPWVTQALMATGFTQRNGWNFTFAGPTASAFAARDLSVRDYLAWVVNEPTVTLLDGDATTPAPGFTNADAGGAAFQLMYTPRGNDPVSIHFIQAVRLTWYNGESRVMSRIELDNFDSRTTPWYDGQIAGNVQSNAGIGDLRNNASWMEDTPGIKWNPAFASFYNFQAQVFVAVDTMVGNTNNVTLYAGEWWGFNYNASAMGVGLGPNPPTASAVPEPSTVVLGAFGLLATVGLASLRGRRNRSSVARFSGSPSPSG